MRRSNLFVAFLCVLLSLMTMPLMAQRPILSFVDVEGSDAEGLFAAYVNELASCDIAITRPENFHSIEMRGRKYINEFIAKDWSTSGISVAEISPVALESDNNDVVFVFPTCVLPQKLDLKSEFVPMAEMVKSGRLIEAELRHNLRDMKLDVTPLISVIANEDMSAYANADTAVIYEFDFHRPLLDQYRHCVGIYLRKYAHTPLLLKIALNDAGYADKEKYIRILLDNISYGDNSCPELVECEKLLAKDMDFPTTYRKMGGIIEVEM